MTNSVNQCRTQNLISSHLVKGKFVVMMIALVPVRMDIILKSISAPSLSNPTYPISSQITESYFLKRVSSCCNVLSVLASRKMSNIERSNIQYRLNSGLQQYINKAGKLGRKVGFWKTNNQLKEEYRNVITMLRKGYSVRDIAKLENISPATVQKIKNVEKALLYFFLVNTS